MDLLQTVRRTATSSTARRSLGALATTTLRTFTTTRPTLAPPPFSSSSTQTTTTTPSSNMERIQQILDGASSSSSLLTPTTKAKPSSPPRPGPPPSLSSTLNLNLKDINDKEALNIWKIDNFIDKYKTQPKKEIELRTKVPLGRTINITRGMDAAAAIHKLNVQVARNKVHHEWRSRKFYERPALRRKRLRLERKEARFAESVRAAIGRTMKLRQMGW